jgi:hypothetical protein
MKNRELLDRPSRSLMATEKLKISVQKQGND